MSFYIRPVLLVSFILACLMWYVTADAAINSSNIFLPPEPGREIRPAPAPLPEPASLLILGSGVAAVGLIRKRKGKK
jgi:PEP-CTERM motif